MRGRLLSTMGAALIFIAVAGLSTQAFALQACVNKLSAATRILLHGGSRKRTETSISLPTPTQVVDSTATIVGEAYPGALGAFDYVLRQVSTAWVLLPVTTSGFVDKDFLSIRNTLRFVQRLRT
jgi:hypothetical protein